MWNLKKIIVIGCTVYVHMFCCGETASETTIMNSSQTSVYVNSISTAAIGSANSSASNSSSTHFSTTSLYSYTSVSETASSNLTFQTRLNSNTFVETSSSFHSFFQTSSISHTSVLASSYSHTSVQNYSYSSLLASSVSYRTVSTSSNCFTPVTKSSHFYSPVMTSTDSYSLVPTSSQSIKPVPTGSQSFTPVPTGSQSFTPVLTGSQSVTSVPTSSQSVTPVPTSSKSVTSVPTSSKSVTSVPTSSKSVTPIPISSKSVTSVLTVSSSFSSVPASSSSYSITPTSSKSVTDVLASSYSLTRVQANSKSFTPTLASSISYSIVPTSSISITPGLANSYFSSSMPEIPSFYTSVAGSSYSYTSVPVSPRSSVTTNPKSEHKNESHVPEETDTIVVLSKDTVPVKVELVVKIEKPFQIALMHKTSPLYKNYTTEFKTKLVEVYKTVNNFLRIDVIGFRNGSTVCDYTVVLTPGSTIKPGNEQSKDLQDQTAVLNKTSIFGTTMISPNSSIAKVFQEKIQSDPCYAIDCGSGYSCDKVVGDSVSCKHICTTLNECQHGGECLYDPRHEMPLCRDGKPDPSRSVSMDDLKFETGNSSRSSDGFLKRPKIHAAENPYQSGLPDTKYVRGREHKVMKDDTGRETYLYQPTDQMKRSSVSSVASSNYTDHINKHVYDYIDTDSKFEIQRPNIRRGYMDKF